MTGLSVHIPELTDSQIDDINDIMSSGYFSSKASMTRVALLLLVFVVKHMPECLLFIAKTQKLKM